MLVVVGKVYADIDWEEKETKSGRSFIRARLHQLHSERVIETEIERDRINDQS